MGEPPAEVAGGGGVGDAARPEGIEEGSVVAAEFDVREAGAVAECVVGDVQDVVGLVIREVDFQEVEAFVDGLGQTKSVGEQVDDRRRSKGRKSTVGRGSKLRRSCR